MVPLTGLVVSRDQARLLPQCVTKLRFGDELIVIDLECGYVARFPDFVPMPLAEALLPMGPVVWMWP